MIETDADLHVLFAYEDEHPDHESVCDQLSYQSQVGSPIVSNGEVEGELLSASGGEVTSISDLFRFDLRVQHYAMSDEPGWDTTQSERVEAHLEFVEAIYEASDPRPGFVYGIQHSIEEALINFDDPAPADAASLADDRINHAVWLNLFPPPLVEIYGRETLVEASAWHVEELDDGVILLVSTPNPTYSGETAAIDDHLGMDAPPELDDHQY